MISDLDLGGKKFGRWTFNRRSERLGKRNRRQFWWAQCDCGTVREVVIYAVLLGKSQSCGCIRNEITAEFCTRTKTTHGLSSNPVYNSWKNAIRRCYWAKDKRYKNYGGRGIKVCEYLRASPQNMVDLLGYRQSKLSIDRIDNNCHYSCGQCSECLSNHWQANVRWANNSQQNRNCSRNRLLTINGVTMCVSDWSDKVGISHHCIRSRLQRGIIGEALIAPLKRHPKP